jgi:hypothetical protein
MNESVEIHLFKFVVVVDEAGFVPLRRPFVSTLALC